MKPKSIKHFLDFLLCVNLGQRRALYELATQAQVALPEENCLNLIKNLANLTPGDLAKIRWCICTIKHLADHNVPAIRKKNLVQQRGAFLTALLPCLGNVVSAFLTR